MQAKPIAGRPAPAGHRPLQPARAHGADLRFDIDPVQIGLARSGGDPLPRALLAKMEAAFGADFSAVRVHVGPQPARIGALAFTTGDQLYFSPGQYQPDTPQGQRLIGHELAHVIQQRQGRVAAHGAGVAVVQNKLLEAEADRLGARAAAWHARPAAPVRPALRSTSSRPTSAQTVQRMLQTPQTLSPEPNFKIDGNARFIFDQGAREVDQGKLNSVAQTGAGSGLVDIGTFNGRDYVMSDATAGVFARLKVNGDLLVIGKNQHTHPGDLFVAGTQMRNKNKDNFHAEDWVIKGFKDAFAAAKIRLHKPGLTLDEWLETFGNGKNGNAGNPGKHFISLAVSACPCLGCTVSLRAFHAYLATALTANGFVFRVKFLRTYELPITAYNRGSELAQAFVSTIGGLREVGIHVRMQPTRSAKKLYGQEFTGETIRAFATNHDAVQNILTGEQGQWLRQSWYNMGVSRKGVPSPNEDGVRFGTAPTRDFQQPDYGDMAGSFVLEGSLAANRPKKERKTPTQGTYKPRKKKVKEIPTEQPMRRHTGGRHAPYPAPNIPSTVTAPPPTVYGAPPPYLPPYQGGPPQGGYPPPPYLGMPQGYPPPQLNFGMPQGYFPPQPYGGPPPPQPYGGLPQQGWPFQGGTYPPPGNPGGQ